MLEKDKSNKGKTGHRWTSEEIKAIHAERKERRKARMLELGKKMLRNATRPVTGEEMLTAILEESIRDKK